MNLSDAIRKFSPVTISALVMLLCLEMQQWALVHTRIGPHLFEMHPFFPFNVACIYIGYRFGLKVGIFSLAINIPLLMSTGLEFTDSIKVTALLNFLACVFFILIFERLKQAKEKERNHHKAQTDFMAMLAHEFKSPLSVMETSAYSISLIADCEMVEGRLQNQLRAIDDMSNILNRLLEVDLVEGKNITIEPKIFQVRSLLIDIIDDAQSPDQIEIHCDVSQTVMSDPVLLRRILTNLVDNALKYGPLGEPVKLEVFPDRHKLKSGIAFRCINQYGSAGPPDPKKVFTKYYRSVDVTGISGAGVGLWLCKKLIEALSGDIRLEQRKGEVSFYVWVPDL